MSILLEDDAIEIDRLGNGFSVNTDKLFEMQRNHND